MNRDVIVRDVGPRDGLQLLKTVLPTKIKLDWIKADIAAGDTLSSFADLDQNL